MRGIEACAVVVSVCLLGVAGPAAAQTQTPEERRASQVLEDVCSAVSCDSSQLRQTVQPIERVAALRTVAGSGLDAVYAALGAGPRAGATVNAAAAMVVVRQVLEEDCQACPLGGPQTLGIPQKAQPDPHPYLLERSMLFPFQKGLILEAQVAPHLYFWENLTKTEGVQLEGGHAFAVSVTPMFKVRIRHEKSSPVQTLSFMPKLNVQYFHLPTRQPADAPGSGELRQSDPWPNPTWLKGGMFVWGHHSNGQTECLYQGPTTDGDCAPPSRLDDVRINYPTGSFSTNYLRFTAFTTRLRIPTNGLKPAGGALFQQTATAKTTFAATLEINPRGLPPGGHLKEPGRSLYGPTRVGALVEHEQRIPEGRRFWTGSWRMTGSAEWFNNTVITGVSSSNLRWTLEGAWEPDWFRSGGFVVRWVHGQDYYNLQFTRDINWVQFGIVFSASEFEPFLIKRLFGGEQ